MSMSINAATFGELDWGGNADLHSMSGSDAGQVLVRLDVDGTFTGVYADLGQTSDLTALRRAIEALQGVHDRLVLIYGDQAPVGRCLGQGEWGRCTLPEGHSSEHALPSEERWLDAERAIGEARR